MSKKDIYKSAEPNKDQYWQDVENKVLDPKVLNNEFAEEDFDSFSVKKNRRSFLKIMGFSVTALPLTGCIKIPVRKAIPYLYKNDTVIPGVANWYATSYNGYPLLAKTREGRPIKIEGNVNSTVTKGAANAQMQASVISLYDSYRYNSAMISETNVEWDEFDKKAKAALSKVKESGKEIVLVTSPIASPSELKLVNEFSKKVGVTVVTYDATANEAILDASEQVFGKRINFEYNLEKADLILSFGADFLGSYGDTLGSSRQYTARKKPDHKRGLSKHVQIEALMSMTGSNADVRYTRSVETQRKMIVDIYNYINKKSIASASADEKMAAQLADDLMNAGGNAVVMSDDQNVDVQLMVTAINEKIGAFDKTIFAFDKEFVQNSNRIKFQEAITRLDGGKVGAMLFLNVNPVYDFFGSEFLVGALKKADMTMSFATAKDETSALCEFIAPNNHAFETWSDVQVNHNEFAFTQPVMQPLLGSRMATETMMALSGIEGSFHDYMKNNWSTKIHPKSNQDTAVNFWNKSLHDGVVVVDGFSKILSAKSVNINTSKVTSIKYPSNMMVQTYIKSAIGDGSSSNNPFLQELPDPVTKATWDNYVMVSPKVAISKSIKSGDMVTLKSKKHSITVPAIVQPGTADNTFGIALGYGRSVAGKVAKNLGGNAYPFINGEEVSIEKTGEFRGLAQTQTHHSMEGRDIIRETTYSEYKKNPKAGNLKKAKLVNIYPVHEKNGHQWAMAIDLSTCTGCSACIVSCSTENNVPVVGRQEVANRREMHWLRLDRYYKGDENEPEVMNMPMLCQHCENAPCENVCPVLATVHSSDGINQQIYNRCVGTRYCANNCPYKVRRFNWFNYDRGDSMAKLALNPDISQRSRGVMEKCSFCIQRIQEGKLEAKKERRNLKDGDIKVACQQSCPGGSIVFGDMMDPNSKISNFLESDRNYTVLEELNVRPRVSYLTKVRNK